MKKSRKKSYTKGGDYIEVSCPSNATYDELCEVCAEALEMECELGDEYLYELKMFRIDGTIVPNKSIGDHTWTIGEYLRAHKRNAAQMKLGVRFVDSFIVSTFPTFSYYSYYTAYK